MASINYINECKNDAYKNRLGKIEIAEKKATTGTSIKIEKGADSAIDLTLYGKSTQATRSGKNLFTKQGNATPKTDTTFWNGITYTTPESDGWCKVSVDNTNGTATVFANQMTKRNTIDKLEVNKTYSILVEVRNLTMSGSSSTPSYLQLCETAKNSVWQSIQNYDLTMFKETNKVVFQMLTKTNFDSSTMGFRNFVSVPKGYKVEFEYRLMVVKGSYTLDTIGEYEPYGVMPSPDFPSPIESVGRKNLFDVNSITENTYLIAGTGGTGSSSVSNVSDFIFVKANQAYYLSYSYTSLLNTAYRTLCYYDTNKNFISGISIDPTSFHTFTPTQDGYVRFSYDKNYTNIQLEKGTVATDYVPYEHTEISATVTGKNLVNPNLPVNSKTQNGITITNNGDGTYTATGTSTSSLAISLTQKNTIKLNKSTSYTNSIEILEGNFLGAIVVAVLDSEDKITYNYMNVSSSSLSNTKTPTEDLTIKTYEYYIDKANITVNFKFRVQLEKGSVATDYEEYKSNSLTIDLQSNELCSLPNGVKDEVNIVNGEALLIKKSKKIKIDVSQIGTTSNYQNITYATIPKPQDFKGYGSYNSNFVMCTNASIYKSLFGTWDTANNINFIYSSAQLTKWWIGFQKDTTLEQMKSSLANAEILYELAKPETINLGTVEMPHTYDGVSNITNSADTEMTVKAYEWTDEITNYDNLQSIQIDSGCYTDGNIIGSVYVECLNANFVASATNLVDKIIRCQIGVKYADLSTEYICKGKYIIERPNNEITAQMSQITAYSGLYTNLEAIYICNLDYSAGNITLKDVYIDVCKQLGLTPLKTDFLNSTIPITDNPFKNNEKNRVVLQTISKIACSFVNVYEDNNQIDLCWLSENAEPDYTFEMSDYVSVEGGQVICGPINCLIIKNSQIDDENVTIKDDESIKANGEHSITISDDYILHNAELRQQAITSIWNRVKGLKYVDCKLITYYGKPFLKLGNKIRIYTSDTDYFDTYVLKHKFEYDGAFASTIESPALTEQEIKTKQDISLGKALANVQIDLDKQKERITSTVTTTNALQDSVSNLSETVQEQANQMQTLSTTLTQTNQSLQAEVNQINESLENGVSNLKNKLVTIDINGIAVSTNTSAIKAIMNNDRFAIRSGDTEAFYVGYDENLKKSVSRMNDLTITDYFTAGYHRQERFEIDGEKRTGWFYVGGE